MIFATTRADHASDKNAIYPPDTVCLSLSLLLTSLMQIRHRPGELSFHYFFEKLGFRFRIVCFILYCCLLLRVHILRANIMPKQLFKEGSIVLAKDSGKLYGAKVLRAQCFSNAWKYFIHFQHWNRKWDKWVDESNLLAYDIELDDQLKKRGKGASATGRGKRRATNDEMAMCATTENSDNIENSMDDKENAAAVRKRRKQLAMEDLYEETDEKVLLIMNKLQIPVTLKNFMVDEWELITRKPRHLLTLPRPVPVATLIDDFLAEKLPKMSENQRERYQDLFVGLRVYFDKALPAVLLYRQEQPQYDAFRAKNKNMQPSLYYGAEHLLRLYAKMPKLLSTVVVPQSDLNFMQSKLCDLLKYLQKNHEDYLILSDYKKCDEKSANGNVCSNDQELQDGVKLEEAIV